MPKSITIENSQLKYTNAEDSDLNLFGLVIDNTYFKLPAGNTLQRPASAQVGMLRFNTEIQKIEGYDGSNWVNVQP